MRLRVLAVVLFALAATLVPGSAHAIVVQRTLEEYCEMANLIVVGRVRSVESRWKRVSYGTIIVSDSVIEVEAVVHGRIQRFERIALTTRGGEVEGVSMKASESPYVREGQRYLLVMKEPEDSRRRRGGVSAGGSQGPRMGRLHILGGAAGAVKLDADAELPGDDVLDRMWRGVCQQSDPAPGDNK
jgi:hypothetical protein